MKSAIICIGLSALAATVQPQTAQPGSPGTMVIRSTMPPASESKAMTQFKAIQATTKPAPTALTVKVGTSTELQPSKLTQASPTLLSQVRMASETNRRVLSINQNSYVDPKVLVQHRQLVEGIHQGAKLVQENHERYGRTDLAMTKYLLAKADIEARELEARAGSVEGIRVHDLAPLRDAMLPFQAMKHSIQSGKAPLPHWTVKVTVQVKPGDRTQLEGLRVYALPKEMFTYPEKYEEKLIDELLVDFSFQNLTSPAEQQMPVGELRIWVGPEYAYKHMRQLIRNGKLTQFKPLHANAGTSAPVELTFFQSDVIEVVSK
jgi:hypothetical protein